MQIDLHDRIILSQLEIQLQIERKRAESQNRYSMFPNVHITSSVIEEIENQIEILKQKVSNNKGTWM